MKTKKKRGRGMFVVICISAFLISFGLGVVSKVALPPGQENIPFK